MKSLKTVNVLHIQYSELGNPPMYNIRNWQDNPEGNKAAEKYFKSLISKKDKKDIDTFLEEGCYSDTNESFDVLIVHST